ncbi:hypothetical protein AEB_P2976 [Altererythrobacter sp. B11]|nr:hypothetical protein AEB_P2976 [Altererythrobacter sp. B11]
MEALRKWNASVEPAPFLPQLEFAGCIAAVLADFEQRDDHHPDREGGCAWTAGLALRNLGRDIGFLCRLSCKRAGAGQ